MKISIAKTSVFALVAAGAPTPPATSSSGNKAAKVYLRLMGDTDQHYQPIEQVTSTSGRTIDMLIGNTIDVVGPGGYGDPLVGIEMTRIEAGSDCTGLPVQKDDAAVVCKISLGGSSKGPTLSLRETQFWLNQGKTVYVTRLSCWKESR